MPQLNPPRSVVRPVRAKYQIRAGPFTIKKDSIGCVIEPTPRILAAFPAIAGKLDSTQVLVKFPEVPEIIVHLSQIEIIDTCSAQNP